MFGVVCFPASAGGCFLEDMSISKDRLIRETFIDVLDARVMGEIGLVWCLQNGEISKIAENAAYIPLFFGEFLRGMNASIPLSIFRNFRSIAVPAAASPRA